MPHGMRPEDLLAVLLETSEAAVIGFTLEGRVACWSSGAEKLYGYSAREVAGERLTRLTPIYEIPAWESLLEQARRGESPAEGQTERLRKDGTPVRVMTRYRLLHGSQGEATGLVEIGRLLEWRGSEAPPEPQLRALMRQVPGIVWTCDQNLRITSHWGAGIPGIKIRPGDLVGRSVCELLESANRGASPLSEHYDALAGNRRQFEFRRKDRVLDGHVAPLRTATGEIIGCIGVAQDITDRKKSEEKIHYRATHDALTGLANYREFIDTLERETKRADRGHGSFTVLLLDLDDLKRINDRYGHLAGNRALRRLAKVMTEHCRSTDLAARYGGDEFGVLLIDSDVAMAEQVAERIGHYLENDEEKPKLSVSIGIGEFPADGRTSQELLEAADRQLYRRKRSTHAKNGMSVALGKQG
jgi:diguanylate cyclase (GGDEF)-like protein/PAS domain S-box-containing protein